MRTDLYNQEGERIKELELPENIFGLPLNQDLIWQVVNSQRANRRKVIAHTKDRSEVRGGGKKPWRQKGTGRARHGSIRSPLWIGGGTTFGPRKEKKFKKKIPEKMRRKALLCALSDKERNGLLIVVDEIKINEPKTKEMFRILSQMRKKIKEFGDGKTLIVLPEKDDSIKRASRNIPEVKIIRAQELNVLDILSFKYIILSLDSLEIIKKIFKV